MKQGRISKKERAFIESNLTTLSVDQISTKLNRNPVSVDAYIKKNFRLNTTPEEFVAYDLEDRPFWYDIKLQFDEDELKLFRYHWSKIVAQFNNDVLPTEELQIIDVVKVEILMNRCLRSNKENIDQINKLIKMSAKYEESEDVEDIEKLGDFHRNIAVLRAAQDSLNKDYRDLLDKKAKMLKDMKGTREQRIKRLEDAKESFPSWVAALMQDPKRLKKYGVDMEKMRMATEAERHRLSQYHKYEDGQVDIPFLNSESVMKTND